MANPVGFPGVNKTFLAPKGEGDNVRDLQVHQADFGSISCWRLTDEEMKAVAKTGVVWLTISGHSMPPVYVQGTSAMIDENGDPVVAEPFLERPLP